MSFLPLDTLRSGASELGFELTDEQLELFDRFASILVEANEKFNLTRITQPEDIVVNHYLDSLVCLSAQDVKREARIVDVGTGAGFPGIPIKIVRPDLQVALVDGTFKKVNFLAEAVGALGLVGIEAVHARAEDLGHEKQHRERYEVAYARALSEMKALAELCMPLVKTGGRVVATKSDGVDEEIRAARALIGQLGGSIEKTVRTHIPGTEISRRIVVIIKGKPTSPQFPRAYSRISSGKR